MSLAGCQPWYLERKGVEADRIILNPIHQTYLVGRGVTTDIRLLSNWVSKIQAHIRWNAALQRWVITDQKPSMNGTFVNSVKVNTTEYRTLEDGDLVGFGMDDLPLQIVDQIAPIDLTRTHVYYIRKGVKNEAGIPVIDLEDDENQPTTSSIPLSSREVSSTSDSLGRSEPSDPLIIGCVPQATSTESSGRQVTADASTVKTEAMPVIANSRTSEPEVVTLDSDDDEDSATESQIRRKEEQLAKMYEDLNRLKEKRKQREEAERSASAEEVESKVAVKRSESEESSSALSANQAAPTPHDGACLSSSVPNTKMKVLADPIPSTSDVSSAVSTSGASTANSSSSIKPLLTTNTSPSPDCAADVSIPLNKPQYSKENDVSGTVSTSGASMANSSSSIKPLVTADTSPSPDCAADISVSQYYSEESDVDEEEIACSQIMLKEQENEYDGDLVVGSSEDDSDVEPQLSQNASLGVYDKESWPVEFQSEADAATEDEDQPFFPVLSQEILDEIEEEEKEEQKSFTAPLKDEEGKKVEKSTFSYWEPLSQEYLELVEADIGITNEEGTKEIGDNIRTVDEKASKCDDGTKQSFKTNKKDHRTSLDEKEKARSDRSAKESGRLGKERDSKSKEKDSRSKKDSRCKEKEVRSHQEKDVKSSKEKEAKASKEKYTNSSKPKENKLPKEKVAESIKSPKEKSESNKIKDEKSLNLKRRESSETRKENVRKEKASKKTKNEQGKGDKRQNQKDEKKSKKEEKRRVEVIDAPFMPQKKTHPPGITVDQANKLRVKQQHKEERNERRSSRTPQRQREKESRKEQLEKLKEAQEERRLKDKGCIPGSKRRLPEDKPQSRGSKMSKSDLAPKSSSSETSKNSCKNVNSRSMRNTIKSRSAILLETLEHREEKSTQDKQKGRKRSKSTDSSEPQIKIPKKGTPSTRKLSASTAEMGAKKTDNAVEKTKSAYKSAGKSKPKKTVRFAEKISYKEIPNREESLLPLSFCTELESFWQGYLNDTKKWTGLRGNVLTKDVEDLDQNVILKCILNWQYRWLQQQDNISRPPPLLGPHYHIELTRVKQSFSSLKEYQLIFYRLLLLELWDKILKAWQEKASGEFIIGQRNNFVVRGKSVDVSCLIQVQDRNASSPQTGDLALWRYRKIGAQSDEFGFVYLNNVYATGPKKDTLKVCFVSKFRNINHDFKEVRLKVLTNVGVDIRIMEGLNRLPGITLASTLLQPLNHVSSFLFNKPHLNNIGADSDPIQHSIVFSVLSMWTWSHNPRPKVLMVQGPPGTGKSHLITKTVSQILYNHVRNPNKENRGSCRILLCAPSNAAIDELVRKIHYACQELRDEDRFSMVRIGYTQDVQSLVPSYTVDKLVEKYFHSTEQERKLQMELEHLTKEINLIDVDLEVERKKAASSEVRPESTIGKLERRLHEAVRRKEFVRGYLNSCIKRRERNSNRSEKQLRIHVLKSADVIVSTLGSCRNSLMETCFGKSQKPFTCCIIDEAAQATEVEILQALSYNTDKLMLVGDPQQLPPTIMHQTAQQLGLDKSLFQRLHGGFLDVSESSPAVMLTTQYRMHPEIARFPSHYFYGGRLKTSHNIDRIGPLPPYLLLDFQAGVEVQDNGEIANVPEANFVSKLIPVIMRITESEFKKHKIRRVLSVGVITPYKKQKKIITRNLEKYRNLVEVNTIDGFQGREKDIIVKSCVRANVKQALGFASSSQRLNVALTRSRYSLIICGHLQSHRENPHWRALIEDAERRRLVRTVSPGDSHNTACIEKLLKYDLTGSPSFE